jgi:hypothetical protein
MTLSLTHYPGRSAKREATKEGTAMADARTLMHVLWGQGDPATRTRLLGGVILDLLMEVEALRRTVKELSDRAGPADEGEDMLGGPRHGVPGSRTGYAAAYIDTAWLTHFAAGPSSGWEKLLAEFYSWDAATSEWRECLMLKRLRFSDADIAKYKESASGAETCT